MEAAASGFNEASLQSQVLEESEEDLHSKASALGFAARLLTSKHPATTALYRDNRQCPRVQTTRIPEVT